MTEVFAMIPASSKPLWVLAPVTALCTGLVILFGYVAYSARTVQFEVVSGGLEIVGGFYGRRIPPEAIDLSRARLLDLEGQPEYRPRRRTNGIGLPGYSAGWFRLQNGERALLFVTDPTRVVYIPTRNHYVLLLSVAHREDMLRALSAPPS